MQFDFPTILFLAAVATGLIWAVDAWVFAPRRREAGSEKGEPVLVEYARSFFPIILVVLILRSFVVEPFRIPSGSMMPTLVDGDFILVNKFVYGIRLPVINKKIIDTGSPERGDVVVFRFPKDPSTDYIKRVIGLPGDKVEYRDKVVYINGQPLSYENAGNYSDGGSRSGMSGARVLVEGIDGVSHKILVEPRRFIPGFSCMRDRTFVVPEGQYFVMGDNRDHSNDSRFWCGVPDENLVGRAFMIWMNWDWAKGGIGWGRIGDMIE